MEEGKKKGKGGRENCVYLIKISASYKHRLMLTVPPKSFYSELNNFNEYLKEKWVKWKRRRIG